MTTTPTLDDITHLDFDESLPCETDFHHDHQPPADWFITITCCIERDFVICNDCLEALDNADYVSCNACHAEYNGYRDIITNVRSLRA